MAKNKKPIPLKVPDPLPNIKQWLILGLDPSLSRTGYSLMRVRHKDDGSGTRATWGKVGSLKPESASDPIWLRSKMIAVHLREMVGHATTDIQGNDPTAWNLNPDAGVDKSALGLIISMEYPTPMNDFLVALNRIIHLVFFETNLWQRFATVRILTTNAATLRSLMNLTQKGSKNKTENIQRAYEVIDKTAYPKLDTDACDAVLHTMMARHTCSILMGFPEEVPEKYLVSLCNANQEMKGKGHNARIITKGLLHRREYFYDYVKNKYVLLVRDAANASQRCTKHEYEL